MATVIVFKMIMIILGIMVGCALQNFKGEK